MLSYVAVDASGEEGWDRLGDVLDGVEGNIRAFYMAVGPDLFDDICVRIGKHKLVTPATRVVIEKPVARTCTRRARSTRRLARSSRKARSFGSTIILGKETVQNLMVLRFGNVMYEALWNSALIDHVQITVAESLGVGSRGGYYDGSGALRDMVQNHMLQLLCLVAWSRPTPMTPTRSATKSSRS
jgi:glucose-6-phosphate 1-dehydrogenase